MKMYLGGPMRGLPLYNYQAFEDAAYTLRSEGHEVVSPHEIDLAEGYVQAVWSEWHDPREFHSVELTEKFTMERALRRDIAEILDVEAVTFLPGWEQSQGCAVEDKVRQWLGLPRLIYVGNESILVDSIALMGADA